MSSSLGAGHHMNFINDHQLGGAEMLPDPGTGQHQVKTLRGCDEDITRRAQQLLARSFLRGIAGADIDLDTSTFEAKSLSGPLETNQRCAKVAFHVVNEGFKWRYIHNFEATLSQELESALKMVQRPEKGREGLTTPVGARSKPLLPDAMRGQPKAWTSVGCLKLSVNQARPASENGRELSVFFTIVRAIV